jgi:hypothetical protein
MDVPVHQGPRVITRSTLASTEECSSVFALGRPNDQEAPPQQLSRTTERRLRDEPTTQHPRKGHHPADAPHL